MILLRSVNATKHVSTGRAIALAISIILLSQQSDANGIISSDISIGVIGDQTGTRDLDRSYRTLREGIDVLNTRDIDIVLHVGDLLESTQSEQEMRQRFAQATTLLNRLRVPWYLTAGDHDVNPIDWTANSQDRSRETLFKRLYSPINPKVVDHLWYSFDVKAYHFVVLDSLERLRTDPRWGNIFLSQISDDQFEWLRDDLQKNASASDGVIVLLHQPLWFNWTNWGHIHELLAKYNTRIVIAGHTHYNQVEPPLDGIQYIVVGATGADTKEGSENAGDLQHTTVLHLTKEAISSEIIPLTGYSHRHWTDRPTMDRVQAADVSLSNLKFDTFGIRNNKLYSSCDSSEPAKLKIENIGNPTDVPMRVVIDLAPPNTLELTNRHFSKGVCQTDVSEYECVLLPSANVVTANNSMVQNSYDGNPVPLWTAEITSTDPTDLAGLEIPVRATLSIARQNSVYTVHHDASLKFELCK